MTSPHIAKDHTVAKVTLYRVDPARRMYQFYNFALCLNLFGQWCFVREWGRIGGVGHGRDATFSTLQEAENALTSQVKRRERHQYVVPGILLKKQNINLGLFLQNRPHFHNISQYKIQKDSYDTYKFTNFTKSMPCKPHPHKKTLTERLIIEKEYMEMMEELLCDRGTPPRISSSSDRIRASKDKKEAVLNERVIDIFTENLGFGVCTFVLHNSGIVTVRDLVSRTEEDLHRIRRLGPKKIEAIKSELADCGLRLKSSLPVSQFRLSL